jgi:hypothetical protein
LGGDRGNKRTQFFPSVNNSLIDYSVKRYEKNLTIVSNVINEDFTARTFQDLILQLGDRVGYKICEYFFCADFNFNEKTHIFFSPSYEALNVIG